MDVAVNFVSAPLVAKQRGVKLLESSEPDDEFFHSRIRVRAACGDREQHALAGTVFGRTPKIVRVDDMHLDLDPKGPILITRHADRPGVVGLLGTVLGAHGVNIRSIELGPPSNAAAGATALATGFLSLYSEPAPEVLVHLRGLEPVREVKLVSL
jgi:D-3-phosphoglycerate dehydrogenase